MTLYFDLDSFVKTSDPSLLGRVPQRLAHYYLAFPLAEEDGRVTVITAHPDNKAALWVLRRLLDADIVPVSSSEAAVRETITRIYAAEITTSQTIVAWAEDATQSEPVRRAAEMFSRVLEHPITFFEGKLPLGDALRLGEGEECSLLVAGVVNGGTRFHLLRGSSTTLLLVRGEPSPVKSMLVVLRGYGSDHQTIERALPFLAHEGARAIVLPLFNLTHWQANPHVANSLSKSHLESCLDGLTKANVSVSLRLRHGNPIDQLVTELSQGDYDLLAIAAEARGDFIQSLLARIDAAGVFPTQPILIVKPPVGPASALD